MKESRMKKKIYLIILFITTITHVAPAEEPVYFADVNLKAVVEEALGVTDPTPTDMLRLTSLDAYNKRISDLAGLEHATNLQTLGLYENQISDISSLSALKSLQELYLSENQISDISPLSGLTSLRDLNLSNNQSSDISPLSGLTSLRWLGIQGNQISEISPLSGLTSLKMLYLDENQITDFSPLSGLTSLQRLRLSGNQISDMSLLSGLTSLQYLSLLHTQISDISPLCGLTSLQELNLGNNQISDISPLSGLIHLQELWLGSNQISDISLLSGLTSLQRLDLGYNPLGIDAYTIHIPLLESYGTNVSYDPLIWRTLTTGSTTGGSVVEPGEGDFDYTNRTVVNIYAVADPGYHFINWTGTAVDVGKVANPAAAGTTVTMEADYTLQANFEQIQLVLYVDDDAPNDPWANNPEVSDLDEDGSPEHPYDTIQEAIDAAEYGDTVLVYPGLYQEEINFLGKAITVQGVATSAGIPILENAGDFAASFYYDEGHDSILKNFVIRNSFMAIFIAGSFPTISNVTVVNNKFGIKAYAGAETDISNSIFWNNTDGDMFQCQARYSCIERADEGEGNTNADPLFVDPNNGDFHLRSERGRHWPEHDVWVLDNITSPCIDAGDPMVDPSDEPVPNGARLNMGAYGGTHYASMSESPVTGIVLPPEVVEQVHGITGGFHYDSTWFIAKFHNGSNYTITQVTINIRMTDKITYEQQWYEVVLGPPGAVIPPGETVILSGDVGITRKDKDFYWDVGDIVGYLN